MTDLEWRNASVDLGGRRVVDGISMRVGLGELVVLVGANGAGKTTVLRAGLGLAPPSGGEILLDSTDPRRTPPDMRARKLAYLPQTRPVAWDLAVRDVVALGRFAHGASLSALAGTDAEAVDFALQACRLDALAGRKVSSLSGGEQARVHMARTLASRAPLILADEPAAMLDPRHAFECLAILKQHCATGGGALVTLHDLNLALRFADRIIVMRAGRILADAAARSALSPQVIREAFGVAVSFTADGLLVEGPA